jgi:hypothetical protein
VFLAIKVVNTPPRVSIPRDNGETSNNKISLIASPLALVKIAA